MSPLASVPLGSVAEIIQGGRLKMSGKNFVERGFPAYGAGGINGFLEVAEFDKPAVVLSSIGARCGKCFYAEGRWASLANTQLIFPDPEKVDAKFLWYQLNDEASWIRSGTGQPFIKPSNVKSRRVSLPSLAEQRRTAAILDKADALRAMRREAIAKLDQLLQSVFLDMFGDPVTSPKCEVVELTSLCERVTDGTHQSPKWSESGVPFLFQSNIKPGSISFETKKAISIDEWETLTARCPIEYGDILYTIVGSYGNAAMVRTTERFCFQRHIAQLKPKAKILPEFLEAMMNQPSVKRQADEKVTGIAQKTLILKELKRLLVLHPSMQEQIRFREISNRLSAVRRDMLMHMNRLSDEFTSLQSLAFAGTL